MVSLNAPSSDPPIRSQLAVIGGAGPRNPYYFTGRRLDFDERDANGDSLLTLYHYRARAYDPVHGRFLQRDPAEYIDSMNLYEYVKSNPVNELDPQGLFTPGRHERITRKMLEAIGFKAGINEIVKANRDVDKDQGSSPSITHKHAMRGVIFSVPSTTTRVRLKNLMSFVRYCLQ